jgi:outer membrane protein assembly factor BamB
MRHKIFIGSLLFFIVLAYPILLTAYDARGKTVKTDWPGWRGPNRDGKTTEKDWNPAALANGPKIVWKVSVGKGYSSLAVRGQYLYTMGNSNNIDTVYCLDISSGQAIWSYSYPSSLGQYQGPRATPTIDGDYVYTLSRSGDLFCFNAKDGRVIWQTNIVDRFRARPPNWGFAGSPVIEGDLLILNAGVSGIALNKKTGKKIWSSKSGTGGYATPVVYDYKGIKYAAMFGEKALYAVELETGKQVWSYPWRTRYDVNAADPLVFGNKIFISSNYGSGCALLEINDGKPQLVWKNRNMNSHFSSFIHIDGYIYGFDGHAGSSKGYFRTLDIKTGNVVWEEQLGFGSLIAVNKNLIILNSRGDLFITQATPLSYREVSSASAVLSRTCWTPPAYSKGRIYLRNNLGELICIDVSK